MRALFEKIEKQLQSLIEGSIQLLPWNTNQKSVAIAIIHEMRDLVIQAIDKNEPLPNIFSISVHPDVYKDLSTDTLWIDEIQKTLTESAEEYDSSFTGEIIVQFFANPEIQNLNEYEINIYSLKHQIEKTTVLKTHQFE